MHPYVEERLALERLGRLRQEAERERIVRQALAGIDGRKAHGRMRVALGDRLVRLGMRLTGPEHGLPVRVRFDGE